jgi:hypothetical protein
MANVHLELRQSRERFEMIFRLAPPIPKDKWSFHDQIAPESNRDGVLKENIRATLAPDTP